MSTSSANALGLPDRRRLLATLAGAGALTLPALPILAAAPGPIEAMYPDFLRLAKAHDAAIEATWEAEARYVKPKPPKWHPAAAEGGYRLVPLPNNKCRCYLDDSDENVTRLRSIIAEPFVFDPTFIVTEHSHRSRVERATKTLNAIEAWRMEDQRRRDAAGLTAAQAAEGEAQSAADAQRDAMLRIEASSWRELAFQAAVVRIDWSERRSDDVLERLADLAGIEPYLA